MPLCTIFTKCPAPSGPMYATHGSPSGAFAAISVRIGATRSYASLWPPGMIDGPFSAPSSPPDTPVPMKCRPDFARSLLRRMVSVKWVLPPSIRMSPFSSSGRSESMVASVPCAGLHHQQNAARFFERLDELFQRVARHELLVGMLGHQFVGFLAAAVVHRYRMSAALDVQRQIAAHDGQADHADCLFAHVSLRMTEALAARGCARYGCVLSMGAVPATAFRPDSRARHARARQALGLPTGERRAVRADRSEITTLTRGWQTPCAGARCAPRQAARCTPV